MTAAPLTKIAAVDQDISSIKTGEWPERQFPLGQREKPTRRQVIFKQSVLNEIHAHGRSAPDIEVCGVLVGNVYTDSMGPFVYVEACIRGNFSSGRAAQVTFTAKTWSHIQDVLDKNYPELRILGWYHTHPGHGIFLSDMDLFIHKNFFSLPWHLAFVYDPKASEEGLFAWRAGNLAVESFVVQKDSMPEEGPKIARKALDSPVSANESGPQPQAILDLTMRLQTLERRQRWVTAALAAFFLIAVGWPLLLAGLAVMHGAPSPLDQPPPKAPTESAGTPTPPASDAEKSLARTPAN